MYNKCPDSSDQRLNYLHNHNGGVLQNAVRSPDIWLLFHAESQGFPIYVNACMTVCRRPSPECLDWQNSQFINIVGKDDGANPELREIEQWAGFAAFCAGQLGPTLSFPCYRCS
jgi:hypothetical protein